MAIRDIIYSRYGCACACDSCTCQSKRRFARLL